MILILNHLTRTDYHFDFEIILFSVYHFNDYKPDAEGNTK